MAYFEHLVLLSANKCKNQNVFSAVQFWGLSNLRGVYL